MEKETFWLPKWCKTVNLLLKQISSRSTVDHTGCIISCGVMTLTHPQLSQWLMSQHWWNFIGDGLWATVCLRVWTSVVGLSRHAWIKTSVRWKQSDCDCGLFCCSHNATNALKSSPQFQPSVLWLPVPRVTRSLCFQTRGHSSTFSCRSRASSQVFSSSNPPDDELNKKIPVFPQGGCFSVLQNCNKSKKKSSPTLSWLKLFPDLRWRAWGRSRLWAFFVKLGGSSGWQMRCWGGSFAMQAHISLSFCGARMLDIPIETVKNRWPLGRDTMKQDSAFGTIAGAVRGGDSNCN